MMLAYPVNVLVSSLNLFGRVTYSDGTSIRLPVDGTKFQLFGLDTYLSTQIGQKPDLLLKYNVSPDEVAYGVDGYDGNSITERYKLTTMNVNGAYAVKLFGYPVWIDALNGYKLEWYLFNMERDSYHRVTAHVRVDGNSQTWKPLAYGTSQDLRVSVNLRDVDPTYKDHIHSQTINVVLLHPATEVNLSNWTIGFDPNQEPPYGRELKAKHTFVNTTLSKIDISQGETTVDAWLERMYWQTKPIHNPAVEVKAPLPNMFAIVVGEDEYEFDLGQWSSLLSIPDLIRNYDTCFVKFMRRTPDNTLQLGISGIIVHSV
jgi:hypothetical protein